MKEAIAKSEKKAGGFINEFKDFISKGNVIDMAIGVIIGTAFTGIVNGLVNTVIMPLLGLIAGKDIFTSLNIVLQKGADGSLTRVSSEQLAAMTAEAQAVLVNIKIGDFIASVVNFLLMAFCVFVVFKLLGKTRDMRKKKGEVPPAPAEPAAPTQEELLTEIRDILKEKNS